MFLIPGQIQFPTAGNFDTGQFGNHHEHWEDLFRLSHQLIFYQPNLLELSDENTSELVNEYIRKLESLRGISKSVADDTSWIAEGFLGNFKNEIDPILKSTLNDLRHHTIFKVIDTEVIPAIWAKKDEFLRDVADGSVRYIDYLPARFREEYQRDVEALRSSARGIQIGGTYSLYINVLKKMAPYYSELLTGVRPAIEDLADAYIRTKAEDYQIELIYYFLKKYRSETFTFLSINTGTLDRRMEKYMNALQVPPSMVSGTSINEAEVEKYLSHKSSKFFDLRRKILEDIKTITLDLLDYMAVSRIDSLGDYLSNNPIVKEYADKASEYFKSSEDPNYDYVDFKGTGDRSYWIRLRVPTSTIELVKNGNGFSDDLTGEVYLVYKPALVDNDVRFHGNKLLKRTQENFRQVENAIRNLYVEVPLGLTVHDLTISTRDVQTDYEAYYHQPAAGEPIKVSVGYSTNGIWTNFKYDYDKVAQFSERLQLPASAGITLDKVEIDPQTWDPVLTLSWTPLGFLADVIRDNRTFQIRTSEIESFGNDFKHALIERVKNEVAANLTRVLNENIVLLNQVLFASDIRVGPMSFNEETLQGELNVRPVGYEVLLGENPVNNGYLEVRYRLYLREGKVIFELSRPNIRVADIIKDLVRKSIEEMVETLEGPVQRIDSLKQNVAFNLFEGVRFSGLELDLESRTACGGIIFSDLGGETIPLCFNFVSQEFTYEGLTELIELRLKEYARSAIGDLINNQFDGVVADLIHPCNNIPQEFDLFGLTFRKDPNTQGCRVTATLLDGVSSVTVEFSEQGVKVHALDPTPELKQRIIGVIQPVLGNRNELLRLDHPRFQGGQFSVDVIADLSRVDKFAFLSLGPVNVGTASINASGEVSFDGENFGKAIETVVRQRVLTALNPEVERILAEALPPKFDFDGLAMVRINEIKSKIELDRVELKGAVSFETLGGLSLDGLSITIIPSDLSVILDVDGDPVSVLASGLANNFMSSFLEESCDSEIGICDAHFEAGSLTLTGVIRINITDLITFPGIRFSLSPKKFDYTLNPTIPFPGTYPVGPLIVAIDPYLEFDFKEEKISGRTILTFGATEEARATAKVGKVVTELDVSLANLGRMDMEGTLKLLRFIPVYHGEGYLDLGTASFGMSEGTTGLLDKIVHFERKLDFYGDYPNKPKGSMEGSGELEFLGMSAEVRLDGKIHTGYAQLDGTGNVEIPLVNLSGQIGTRYVPYVPVSHLLYGYGRLQGGLEVGDFTLSGFDARVNIHQVSAAFEVLEAKLGITVPVADALTKGKILDLILSMFDFDLKDLVKMLETAKNLGRSGLTFEFGKSDDVEGTTNKRTVSQGGQVGASAVVYENTFTDDGAGGYTTAPAGPIVSLDLDIQKVNETTTRTISVYVGRRCRDWDTWFGCFGGYENVYQDRTITEETFNYRNWGNHWACLPDNYQQYSAIYNPDITHSHSKMKVFDLVHNNVGDRILEGLTPFLIKTPLLADSVRRRIGSNYYLCLSNTVNQLSSATDHCINIDNIPSSIYSKIGFSGNLAYDEENVYIFTSAAFPESGDHYCAEGARYQNYSSAEVVSLKRQAADLVNLQCLNCDEVNGLNLARHDVISLSTFRGYIKRSGVPKTNPETAFEQIVPDNDVNILSDFLEYKAAIDSNEIDLEQLGKDLRTLTRTLPDGSLILFNDGRMIIVHATESGFRSEIFDTDNNEILSKFYELTGRIWIELNQHQFKSLFAGYLPDNLGVEAIFTALKADDYALLKRIKPSLDEYIQNWIYYGSDPRTVDVTTQTPAYDFTVWDYSGLEERKNFTYTFTSLIQSNPLDIKENTYKIPVSDLTDAIEISDASLASHKLMLEDHYQTHVYRNLVFFSAKDTLDERMLISADKDRIVFGLQDTSTVSEQQIRLFTIRPGVQVDADYRENTQLVNMNFNIRSSNKDLDVDLVRHDNFFRQVVNELVDSPQAEAYVEQFPFEEITYRAVIFEGDEVEVIWEKDVNTIRSGIINRNFASAWQNATGGTVTEFEGKRVFSSGSATKPERARMILRWFDGFDVWYGHDSNVNPMVLLKASDD